jgi:RNA recognition motif-containing protein
MATMRLHVGNLPFETAPDDVRTAFEAFGAVYDVSLMSDRATGRSRGFGYVEMDAVAAAMAIEHLDGKDFGGRAITVNEAHERVGGAARD